VVTPIECLPHRPPMLLLDRIVRHDRDSLVAKVEVGPSTLFRTDGGVPSYVGLEYMAQACGAYAGALAHDAGEPAKIGFLLGTRDFSAEVPLFRDGECLTVTAALLYRDEGMASFDCKIEIDGKRLASARLSVYQPPQDPRHA
jgi:predicted hotdog family 3-hydroxylacyl-ACP dehydratase